MIWDEQQAVSRQLNPFVDFIAGTGAGIAGLIAGFPFDTIKVRFQNPHIAAKYRSTLHALVTIVREERVLGLYKGIASPLATAGLLNGLLFATYRLCMHLQLAPGQSVPTLTQIALAGAGSGLLSSVLTAPTELIKIRQQSTPAPPSAWRILRTTAPRALFRGLAPTALRDCGYGAYFLAYEAVCRGLGAPDGRAPSWAVRVLAGGVAGVAGWVTTFPLDVVKTRMQGSGCAAAPAPAVPPADRARLLGPSAPVPADANPYRTMVSTIVHSYRAEGAGVFFRGLAPTLVRAVPVNMVTFVTFEAIVRVLA